MVRGRGRVGTALAALKSIRFRDSSSGPHRIGAALAEGRATEGRSELNQGSFDRSVTAIYQVLPNVIYCNIT
jgi:hypothetical protein